MSLVVLSFFRDAAAATALADLVAAHGGILGAAVCCAEKGGDPSDDWTTCEADRDELLDRWVAHQGGRAGRAAPVLVVQAPGCAVRSQEGHAWSCWAGGKAPEVTASRWRTAPERGASFQTAPRPALHHCCPL